jgi:hypothetical protein
MMSTDELRDDRLTEDCNFFWAQLQFHKKITVKNLCKTATLCDILKGENVLVKSLYCLTQYIPWRLLTKEARAFFDI